MNKHIAQVEVIETTIYNEAPELKKLDCTSCGGTLDIVDHTHALCPHCGRHYKIKHAGNVKMDLYIDSEGIEQTQPMLTKAFLVMGFVITIIVIIVIAIVSYNAGQLGM